LSDYRKNGRTQGISDMVSIKRTNSNDNDFRTLVIELDKDLWSRYGTRQLVYQQYNVIENLETVLVAYIENKPVGCGCFKKINDNSVEIKRMFVSTEHRRKGIGASVMKELENWAKELQFEFIFLETGKGQPEASRLYQKQGYKLISNYGQYIGKEKISICMKKVL